MVKTINWVNGILVSMVVVGIGLVGLSVWLDMTIASKIDWLWVAIAGFGLAFTGACLMKK